MSYHRGLGLSPGDACFDSTRSSLLPYWIDNAQEAECLTGTTNWWDAGWAEIGNQVAGATTGAAAAAASGAASGIEAGISTASPGGIFGLVAIGLGVLLIVGAVLRK